MTASGEMTDIVSVEPYETAEPISIYNLNVDEYHTYFVGNSGLLVHNDCTEDMMWAGREAIENARTKGITDSKVLSEIGETAAKAISKLLFKQGYIEHLKTGISFDRNATKGIVGGHNFDEFKNYFRNVEGLADSEFIESIVPHQSFNGIYEVTYKVPLKDGTGAIIPGQY